MLSYIFYSLSVVTLFCALMVILAKNPVHSVLYLVLTFFSISAHYVLLNAQFLAAVNVIVYAGAIMVLFLFVIMMLNLNKDTERHKGPVMKLIGVVTAGVLLVLVVAVLRRADIEVSSGNSVNIGLVNTLGMSLYNDFKLPFEISGLLLLAAVVGVISLAKKEVQ